MQHNGSNAERRMDDPSDSGKPAYALGGSMYGRLEGVGGARIVGNDYRNNVNEVMLRFYRKADLHFPRYLSKIVRTSFQE